MANTKEYGNITPPSFTTDTKRFVNQSINPGMSAFDDYRVKQNQAQYKAIEADDTLDPTVKANMLSQLHLETEKIRNSYGYSGGDDGSELNYIINPQMRQLTNPYDVNEMANMTGVTVNAQELADIFQAATRAEYAAKEKALDQAQVDFNNNLYRTGNEVQDAINQAMGQSAVSGSASGALAANNLLSALGVSQQGVDENKALAEEKAQLGSQLGAALKQDVTDATKQAENAKQVLAQLAATIQGNTVQEKVGFRSSDATENSTKVSTAGTMHNQDTENNTNAYIADQNNKNDYDIAKLQTDTNKEIAQLQANSNEKIAQLNANSYARNYGGSGYTRSGGGYSGGYAGNNGSNSSGNVYTVNTNEATQAWLDAVEAWGSDPSTKNNSNILILGREILATQGIQNPSQQDIINAATNVYSELHNGAKPKFPVSADTKKQFDDTLKYGPNKNYLNKTK